MASKSVAPGHFKNIAKSALLRLNISISNHCVKELRDSNEKHFCISFKIFRRGRRCLEDRASKQLISNLKHFLL